MSDLINRQAAIDALRAMQTYKMFAGDDLLLIDQAGAQTELMMLPSTQSKTNCSEFPNNSDAISRQAAIDSMCELMRHWFGCDSKDEIREIKRELGKLPSAQSDIIRCNACKHWTQTTGNMPGFGLGDCDYLYEKLISCNGYCYWAERRETDETD